MKLTRKQKEILGLFDSQNSWYLSETAVKTRGGGTRSTIKHLYSKKLIRFAVVLDQEDAAIEHERGYCLTVSGLLYLSEGC